MLNRKPKPKIERMTDILNSESKGTENIRSFDGGLSLLWRTILRDHRVNASFFNQALNKFIRTYCRRLMSDYDMTSVKGNWMKAFAHPRMTWRTMMKALLLLRVKKLTLTVKLEYVDNRHAASVHSTTMDLSPYYDPSNVFDNAYSDEIIESTPEKIVRIQADIANFEKQQKENSKLWFTAEEEALEKEKNNE
jgi:hypothetical protein